jgi:hypothetical protein
MATFQYELVDPPHGKAARELWLQHAAGFILFEDVRPYALERIDPALKGKTRAAIEKGINDAVYGMMMVIEGVSGGLRNDKHQVTLDVIARVTARKGSTLQGKPNEIHLLDGDGMCMGYHSWIDGDFGKDPVAVPRPSSDEEN